MRLGSKTILRIVCAVIILAGCGSCSRTINCTDPDIESVFVSFPVDDIDTLVIRKFRADDNFQHLIDTVRVIKGTTAGYTTVNDTTYISLFNRDRDMIPGYDWQIYLPSTNQTLLITRILTEQTTDKCAAMTADCFCANKILGIQVNNRPASFKQYSSCTLYIKQ